MEKINGVNLGNWLVLEKWMCPALFDSTTAEDEYYLAHQLSPQMFEMRLMCLPWALFLTSWACWC